ncbi:MAG: hypothetical protein LBQ28_09135 [Prevotellaceae bacterium]|jgi:hypothetical protein|nr:hypothetical protein [Prevotellaceae bacterium]
MIFRIDYKRLAVQLLPVSLRKQRIVALFSCAISAIEDIYYNFTTSRNERLRRIRFTPQVCVLQGMLNDDADMELRRIIVEDGQFLSTVPFAYSENEYHNYAATPVLIPDENLIVEQSVYFTISVPWAYGANNDAERRVKWLLNNYKLAGKKYTIKYN